MEQSSREVLELFVIKANRLSRSGYQKQVESQSGINFQHSWSVSEGISVSQNLPDEDLRDAALLTARMFLQKKDRMSFENLAKLDADPLLSSPWKARRIDVQVGLDNFLDAHTWFAIDERPSARPDLDVPPIDEQHLPIPDEPARFGDDSGRCTHRELFNGFLYGRLAHTNKDKVDRLEQWNGREVVTPIVEWEFHRILIQILQAVQYLAHFTKMELAGEVIPPIPSPAG